MEYLGQRLVQIIEDIAIKMDNNKLSVRQFEVLVGVTNGTFAKVIKNNTDTSSENIRKIFYKFPEYSCEWLITGRDKMVREYPGDEKIKLEKQIVDVKQLLDTLLKDYDDMQKKKGT